MRYTQLVRRKLAGRSAGGAWRGAGSVSEGRLGARNWSRRSGYAFAHQEGFGELITSGKNMRLSSLALASFASKHSSSWIDTLRRKRHAPHCASADCSPAPSCASVSVPPLSNSSSVLGSSQDTPIEEETAAASEQNVQVALSSSSQIPPTPAREAATQRFIPPPARPPARGDSSGGWANTLVSVQVSQPPDIIIWDKTHLSLVSFPPTTGSSVWLEEPCCCCGQQHGRSLRCRGNQPDGRRGLTSLLTVTTGQDKLWM